MRGGKPLVSMGKAAPNTETLKRNHAWQGQCEQPGVWISRNHARRLVVAWSMLTDAFRGVPILPAQHQREGRQGLMKGSGQGGDAAPPPSRDQRGSSQSIR